MALTQKYKKISLSNDEYYNAQGERNERILGEKKRIIEGNLIVDYSCFKKSKSERLALRLAKLEDFKR